MEQGFKLTGTTIQRIKKAIAHSKPSVIGSSGKKTPYPVQPNRFPKGPQYNFGYGYTINDEGNPVFTVFPGFLGGSAWEVQERAGISVNHHYLKTSFTLDKNNAFDAKAFHVAITSTGMKLFVGAIPPLDQDKFDWLDSFIDGGENGDFGDTFVLPASVSGGIYSDTMDDTNKIPISNIFCFLYSFTIDKDTFKILYVHRHDFSTLNMGLSNMTDFTTADTNVTDGVEAHNAGYGTSSTRCVLRLGDVYTLRGFNKTSEVFSTEDLEELVGPSMLIRYISGGKVTLGYAEIPNVTNPTSESRYMPFDLKSLNGQIQVWVPEANVWNRFETFPSLEGQGWKTVSLSDGGSDIYAWLEPSDTLMKDLRTADISDCTLSVGTYAMIPSDKIDWIIRNNALRRIASVTQTTEMLEEVEIVTHEIEQVFHGAIQEVLDVTDCDKDESKYKSIEHVDNILQLNKFTSADVTKKGLGEILSISEETGELVIGEDGNKYQLVVRIVTEGGYVIGYMPLTTGDGADDDTNEDPCDNHPGGGNGVSLVGSGGVDIGGSGSADISGGSGLGGVDGVTNCNVQTT